MLEKIENLISKMIVVRDVEKNSEGFYEGTTIIDENSFNVLIIDERFSGNESVYDGKIVGMIKIKDNKKFYLVASDKNSKIDYQGMKGYFLNLKNIKIRCQFERSAGAIIYKKIDDKIMYLIIYSKKNMPGFPKGHLEYMETEEQAALREVKEEVGLDITLKDNFKKSIFYYIDDTSIYKEVVFFLAEIGENEEIIIDKSEINKYEFLTYEECMEILPNDLCGILKKELI